MPVLAPSSSPETVDRNPYRRATFDMTTPNRLDQAYGLFVGEGPLPFTHPPVPTDSAAIIGATGVCETTLDVSNTVEKFLRTLACLCQTDELGS